MAKWHTDFKYESHYLSLEEFCSYIYLFAYLFIYVYASLFWGKKENLSYFFFPNGMGFTRE